MKTKILRYEELAINAFPAILTELYDGWILRYSNGFTYRGNSVNPLYRSTLELDRKVDACEKRFHQRNLPCVFKMTPTSPVSLDEILESKGYQIQKYADIMELYLTETKFQTFDNVTIETVATTEWLNRLFSLNGPSDPDTQSTLTRMLTQIENPVLCASIMEQGQVIACGLGVIEDGYLGLFDIRVHDDYQRKGYASSLCSSILSAGIKNGAHTAYLQVETANAPARKLYEKLGFSHVYTYWYRVH